VLEAVVEVAVAGDVVVDAEQVGRGALALQGVEERGGGSPRAGGAIQRVLAVDAAVEQVEAEPAALVLEVGLVARRGAEKVAPRSSVCTRRASGD
jgi:hypothetical protein